MLVGGILACALLLRFHQLGDDSFWYDEALSALAATSPTLADMWAINQAHFLGPPLDYHLVRLAATFGHSEAVLRTPAVLWSVLALWAWVWIARKVAGRTAALLTGWLLALSAIHVEYAQELRFYASLFCLHALSTALWMAAVAGNRRRVWILTALVSGLGCWFHPYVALAPAMGVCYWMALRCSRSPELAAPSTRRWPWLLITTALTAGSLFVSLSHASFPDRFDFKLLQFNAVGGTLARGLGLAFGSGAPGDAWCWLTVGSTLVGGLVLARTLRRHAGLAALLVATLGQLVLIFGADWYKGYWFLPRQLIHLAPAVMIVTALGLQAVATLVAGWLPGRTESARRVALGVFVVAFTVAAAPRLSQYYESSKGTAREISEILLDRHEKGETIYVVPRIDRRVYEYYFTRVHGRQAGLARRIKPAYWPDKQQKYPGLTLQPGARLGGRAYLIAATNLEPEQQAILDQLGFQELYRPEVAGSRAQGLWYKP